MLRRDAALVKLAQAGLFLEGHLSAFKRRGCAQPGWRLTFKQQGKTRTVYVPVALVADVQRWTHNYRASNNSSGKSRVIPRP